MYPPTDAFDRFEVDKATGLTAEEARYKRMDADVRRARIALLGSIGTFNVQQAIKAQPNWRYRCVPVSEPTRWIYEHHIRPEKPLSNVHGFWHGMPFVALKADLMKLWKADVSAR